MDTALHNQVKTLGDIVDTLASKDKQFARSLVSSYFARGYLSDKQKYWVGELLKRAGELAGEDHSAENAEQLQEVFDGTVIQHLFIKASQNLKFPKLRYQTDGGSKVVFSLASRDNPRWSGTIFIDNGTKGEKKVRYGLIDRDGNGTLRRESKQAIKTFIRQVAKDPSQYAKLQGQRYSNCSFCGLELTNKSSVYHGYGPICANRWGLPWGDTGDLADEEAAAAAELAHINLVDLE